MTAHRLTELGHILDTAPPDQSRIIRALHDGTLEAADLHQALINAHAPKMPGEHGSSNTGRTSSNTPNSHAPSPTPDRPRGRLSACPNHRPHRSADANRRSASAWREISTLPLLSRLLSDGIEADADSRSELGG